MRVLQPSRKIAEEGLALFADWQTKYPDETSNDFVEWEDYLSVHASPAAKEYMESIR